MSLLHDRQQMMMGSSQAIIGLSQASGAHVEDLGGDLLGRLQPLSLIYQVNAQRTLPGRNRFQKRW
jgi:hypothetical protein